MSIIVGTETYAECDELGCTNQSPHDHDQTRAVSHARTVGWFISMHTGKVMCPFCRRYAIGMGFFLPDYVTAEDVYQAIGEDRLTPAVAGRLTDNHLAFAILYMFKDDTRKMLQQEWCRRYSKQYGN